MSDWRTKWIESERYDAMWSAVHEWLHHAAPYGSRMLDKKYGGAVDKAVEAIMSAVDEEAREAEREAAAKIAIDHEKRALRAGAIVTAGWCLDIAAAIRARGEGKP